MNRKPVSGPHLNAILRIGLPCQHTACEIRPRWTIERHDHRLRTHPDRLRKAAPERRPHDAEVFHQMLDVALEFAPADRPIVTGMDVIRADERPRITR